MLLRDLCPFWKGIFMNLFEEKKQVYIKVHIDKFVMLIKVLS